MIGPFNFLANDAQMDGNDLGNIRKLYNIEPLI